MSTVVINSTTDTPEAVTAAIGDLAKGKVIDQEPKDSESKSEKESSEKGTEEKEVKADAKEHEADSDHEDDEPSKEGDDKPKKKGGFKKKIEKLSGRLSAKEQEVEYWKNEALRQQKSGAAEKKVEQKAPASTEGKPKAESFDRHEDFVEALSDWKLDQKLKERDAKQSEAQVKTEHQKKVESHVERVKAFEKEHDDFKELIDDIDDIPMSFTVQEVILESENGPELMYELAKNRKEYEKICKLPAIAAARELGKFEARIAKDETKTVEKKTTKAPPPLKTVGSKSAGSTKSPDEMSYREFKKWREAGGGS
jgi:hypothetical protein